MYNHVDKNGCYLIILSIHIILSIQIILYKFIYCMDFITLLQ